MKTEKIKKMLILPAFWLMNACISVPTALAADANTQQFNVNQYLSTTGQEHQSSQIAVFIIRFINYLTLLIGSFAFLAIVIGGIMMLTSAGNENQINKGKDVLKYAITGLVVAMAAYFITAFVQSIFYEYGTPTT